MLHTYGYIYFIVNNNTKLQAITMALRAGKIYE